MRVSNVCGLDFSSRFESPYIFDVVELADSAAAIRTFSRVGINQLMRSFLVRGFGLSHACMLSRLRYSKSDVPIGSELIEICTARTPEGNLLKSLLIRHHEKN